MYLGGLEFEERYGEFLFTMAQIDVCFKKVEAWFMLGNLMSERSDYKESLGKNKPKLELNVDDPLYRYA